VGYEGCWSCGTEEFKQQVVTAVKSAVGGPPTLLSVCCGEECTVAASE